MDRKSIFVLIGCFLLLMLWPVLWSRVSPLVFPPVRIAPTNQVGVVTNATQVSTNGNAAALPLPRMPWQNPSPEYFRLTRRKNCW